METGIDHIINMGRNSLKRPNWTILSLVGAAVLIAGAIFGSAATTRGWFNGGGGEKVPIYVSSDSRVNDNITFNGGFSGIAKAVTPAVVTIKISSRRTAQQDVPFMFDPFRDFFNQQSPDDEDTPRRRAPKREQQGRGRLEESGVGSGVIVSPDGYILTNNHVVEEADKVEVELTDKRSFTANVVGKDQDSDLAVIKIDAKGLPTVPFGDSDKVEVGDIVLAVGNPLEVGQTVTMGIISAKGRHSHRDRTSYDDFLQTDAAINPGNSGGALVNLHGELIGVPSQILTRGGSGNTGIGFAIPTKIARGVMEQLVRDGKVHRGMLGVIIGPVADYGKKFGYKGSDGAFVQEVQPGLPADQAGIRAGDIITEYQGQKINDSAQLQNLAAQTTPGTTVKIKVFHDGSEREVTAKLTEFERENTIAKKTKSEAATSSLGVLSGISVENLTPEISEKLRLQSSTHGVIIDEVDPDSNAAAAGLRRGDVIEQVEKQPVTNVNEFNSAVQKADKKEVLLRVRRSVEGHSSSSFVIVKSDE